MIAAAWLMLYDIQSDLFFAEWLCVAKVVTQENIYDETGDFALQFARMGERQKGDWPKMLGTILHGKGMKG